MKSVRFPILVSAISLLILCVLSGTGLCVTTMLIRGKVTDSVTKQPIVGAEITFKDVDMGKKVVVKTDKAGAYLQRLQWGNYKALVRAEGYRPFELLHVPKPEGTDESLVDFTLAPGSGVIVSEMTKEEKEKYDKEQEELKKKQQLSAEMKAQFDAAMELKQKKDYPGAIEKLKAALALEPNQPVLLGQIGECFSLSDQQDSAIEWYLKAVEIAPKDGALRTNLGTCYHKKGMVNEAKAQFEAAVQADPLHADVNYYNMGVVMLNSSKIDEALSAFDQCINVNAKYAAAYYQKSMCMLNKGDAKGSLEALETYLKLDPTGPYAQSAKELLPEVKKMVN